MLHSKITERRQMPPTSGSMMERAVERVVTVLDWLWPLPLGALFGAILFLVSAGTWLAFRGPAPTSTASIPRSPQSNLSVPQPREFPPRPSLPTTSGKTGPVTNAEPAPAPGVKAPPQTASVQPELRRTPVSKPTDSTPASKVSPAQRAALQDKLTLGGFFMDRQDYPAALTEFQAALAIDPTNHEAQAAIQRARKAGKEPESGALP
jgi:hypothetical protein